MQHLQANVFADMDAAKAAARQAGKTLIDLSLGSTDLHPSSKAIATLRAAADDPSTYSYSLFQSTKFFRDACANWYRRKFDIPIDPDTEVLPLIGSQEGTAHLPLALLDPGDIALLTNPGYPSHAGGVHLAGGDMHLMPLTADRHFLPDFAAIPASIAARARMMVLSYPNNPTTAIATPAFWQEAVTYCQTHDIALVHDFPYVDMDLDRPVAPSVLTVDRDKTVSIEFFSMSKSFHMGGFRVGFAIGNRDMILALRQVKAAIDFNQYRGILRAAAAVLDDPGDLVERSRQIYRERRDRCIAALATIGWHVDRPSMGMYLWAPLPPTYPHDSTRFCLDLVATTGVALSPGRGFGTAGEGYVRFALMHDIDVLETAISKIGAFLKQNQAIAVGYGELR